MSEQEHGDMFKKLYKNGDKISLGTKINILKSKMIEGKWS